MKIEIEVKDFINDTFNVGDYVQYKGVVYKFLGYEYGTYPIGENIETGETVTLPHY